MLNTSNSLYRDILILLTLLTLAFAGPLLGPPDKFDRSKTMGFAMLVPKDMGQWTQVSVNNSEEVPDKLDINELYQALYVHPTLGRVALTLEYTSDSRREFELHYPDICHSIRGDNVVLYAPQRLELSDGQHIDVASMNWQQRNGGHSAVTAYWYITPDGITIDSAQLKIQQALAGFLSKPKAAVMVRFDAFYEQSLSPEKRAELFVAITVLNQQFQSEIDLQTNNMLYNHLKKEEI